MGKKCIVKERFVKEYRIKELDEKLTRQRILTESRNMARAMKFGINTPYLIFVNLITRKIYMQYIENSVTVKEVLKVIYSMPSINLYDKGKRN
jgi:TP53 regulating kinase-like protein